MMVASHSFKLFADYYQFYIQDENADGDLSCSWTKQAAKDFLAVGLGIVGIGTVRNFTVPVEIEIHDSDPGYDVGQWDHITECGIDIPTGIIVVAGCTDYFPDAARISVDPGSYRLRVHYGNLKSAGFYGLDGEDHYRVVLWPGEDAGVRVIKRWQQE